MDRTEALSALAAKEQAEAQIARAANCPLWRHAVFGLLMGGLVASAAFPLPVRLAILAFILALIPVIVQSDRKRMGMFISGYRRGMTRVVAIGVLIVELVLLAIGLVRNIHGDEPLTPLLLGVAAFLIGVAGSLLWQRVFVRELGV